MNRLNENARTKLVQEEVDPSPIDLAQRFHEVKRLRKQVHDLEHWQQHNAQTIYPSALNKERRGK